MTAEPTELEIAVAKVIGEAMIRFRAEPQPHIIEYPDKPAEWIKFRVYALDVRSLAWVESGVWTRFLYLTLAKARTGLSVCGSGGVD